MQENNHNWESKICPDQVKLFIRPIRCHKSLFSDVVQQIVKVFVLLCRLYLWGSGLVFAMSHSFPHGHFTCIEAPVIPNFNVVYKQLKWSFRLDSGQLTNLEPRLLSNV